MPCSWPTTWRELCTLTGELGRGPTKEKARDGGPRAAAGGKWGIAEPGARAEAAASLRRVSVRLVPAVRDPHMPTFLQQLRVDWPAASERAATEALRSRALAELTPARNAEALPPGALGRVYLKELVDERGRTTGYDPKLDSCLGRTRSLAGPESSRAPHSPPASALCVLFAVTEDLLAVLAELQQAVQDWAEDSSLGLVSD